MVRRFESSFQSFEPLGGPAHCLERTRNLRAELARRGLVGFIVPRADNHQNEYVPPSAERLLWLTGFSGSAGLAIVLQHKAALFVDGRYAIQAPTQVDTAIIETILGTETTPSAWIETNLKPGQRLGYDPWLQTQNAVDQFAAACSQVRAKLASSQPNPIDAIWKNRPVEPVGAVLTHPLRYSGESARAKVARVQSSIKEVEGILVTDPHDVAWLFNIRGSDVAHTPLPLSFAYIPKTGKPTLFLDGRKLSKGVRDRLAEIVGIAEPAGLLNFVGSLGRDKARVAFNMSTTPAILTQNLESAGGKPIWGSNTIALMKARKNNVELAGARAANKRDGAAVTRFLHWLAREAPNGSVTEILAAEVLETFRRDTGRLKEISFPTISAAGPHSAIPHYRVNQTTNLEVGRGLFLIDSGGQYDDGTTDITRTIAVGKPTQEMRDRFTRVLKGHIAIATAVFPDGTTGSQIDAFARQALWSAGLDFDHGTGHGVGSYLSVHEGPQRIAKSGTTALESGMILSNEPGYYSAGRFGIRIENLVVVTPVEIAGGERDMLGFETISFAPIDLNLIDGNLLDHKEIAWLDTYHDRVRATLSHLVDRPTRTWLAKATRHLGRRRAR